jgi:hypothetical protein
MTDYVLPTVKAFPSDDRIWRVDWHGDVFFIRHIRIKTPFIRIAISPYQDQFPYQTDEQRLVSVPVGVLPVLGIGTLWQNGQQVGEQPSAEEIFTIQATKEHCRIAKSGVAEENGEYIIPFEFHQYHSRNTQSWCVVSKATNGISVIVPATEIIRFYFGSSSQLLSRLFTPPFDKNKFWVKTDTDIFLYDIHVDLAEGLSGMSAVDVARIAFDANAQHCAKLISASLLASADTKQYPKAHFPFSGESTIRVSGMWLGPDKKSFLVFRLHSCSHSFPFNKLTYTMAKPASGKGSNGTPGNPDKQSPVLPTSSVSKNVTLNNEPPDKNRKAKTAKFRTDIRFPDLLGKTIARGDPTEQVKVKLDDVQENDGSVPAEEGTSGLPGIDLVPAETVPPMPGNYPADNPDFGKSVLEFSSELSASGYEVSFVPLDARQRFPQVSTMPEIITDDGQIHPLCYVEAPANHRPRFVSVIIATKTDELIRYVYLESDPWQGENCSAIFFNAGAGKETISSHWVAHVVAECEPSEIITVGNKVHLKS